MANENTKDFPMWKRIKQGDRLPCQSFLRKYDGEILRLTTTGGVTVGQDCFYLPVENVIEEIRKFPIDESEDEKIREEIITYLKATQGETLDNTLRFPTWIKWLKNKGDQKPDTKVESRFNVGDWICHKVYKKPLRIVEDLGDGDFRTSPNSIVSAKEIEEGVFKHWYITDAKPGDILYSLDSYVPFIYKGRKTYEQASTYCGININGKFYVEGTKDCIICCEHYRPASSEQRSLLFSKMREAGYEWDAEKLELKKIEKKPILDVEIPFGAKDSELEEVTYDIPKGYHAEIEDNKVVIKKGEQKRQMPLIKSVSTDFKDRLGTLMHYTSVDLEKEENKQLLNEATKELLQLAYSDKANEIALASAKTWEESMAILMAANNAYRRGQKEQKSASWSEEDEIMHKTIILNLKVQMENCAVPSKDYLNKAIGWFQKLKHQKTFVPSEEEMKALEFCLEHNIDKDGVFGSKVVKLYKKLKKLTK